jgi:hypothetical protein
MCNMQVLITNGLLRMGEQADEPEESFTYECVFVLVVTESEANSFITISAGKGGNIEYSEPCFERYLGWRNDSLRGLKMRLS